MAGGAHSNGGDPCDGVLRTTPAAHHARHAAFRPGVGDGEELGRILARRLMATGTARGTAALTRRYSVADLRVFSLAERARFLPDWTPDSPIDRSLSFELLYRLEPDLYDRLAAAERIHPAVLDWLPRVDRAVEIGAGTGRLTTHLLTRCANLVAVEPAGAMRARLRAAIDPEASGRIDIIDGF